MTKNNKDKKSGFSLRRLIYNDKYLIILSIILALVVWIVASLNIGIDETKRIKLTVPIQLGDEVSEQLGMKYYSLQDTLDLNVTISGAKYVIGQVEADDLSVKFDTSSVNRTGQQTIPILVSNKSKGLDFEISSIYPSSIEGYFDVNESRIFDLNLTYDENVIADGFVFSDPVLSEDKVVISGPKSYIDKIDRALVNVNFGENIQIKETYKAQCAIDIQGSGVETSYLTITSRSDPDTPINSVSVTLPVLKKTQLPVKVNIEDVPEGIDQNDVVISYSQESIEAGVLESANIHSAVIGTISYNQLGVGANFFEFDVKDLEGITVLDDDVKTIKVTVNVSNRYTRRYQYVNKNDILVEGVEKGYKAIIRSMNNSNISIISPSAEPAVTAADIVMKCDVSEISEDGLYDVSISLKTTNGSWVYGTYTVKIDIVSE